MPQQDISGGIAVDFSTWPWPAWVMIALLALLMLAHTHKSMRDRIYGVILSHPYSVMLLVIAASIYFTMQVGRLHWETNSRVFFPKDHPAILYNNEIEKIFGVKEPIIIGIVNEEKGIYNTETLERIKRITEKLYSLPGIVADRKIDIASISSATYFSGNETEIRTTPLMPEVPTTQEQIDALQRRVQENADLFVGNIVSADGKAAMIRAKVKEDIGVRYQTYFTINNLLAQESGVKNSWGGGQWGGQGGQWSGQGGQGDWQKWQSKEPSKEKAKPAGAGFDALKQEFELADAQEAPPQDSTAQKTAAPTSGPVAEAISAADHGDHFYLAGRPVIEVLYGVQSQEDLKLMVPLLLLVLTLVLFVIFRAGLGVLLPMAVMVLGIAWSLGVMGALGYPMYTISVMLPIILIAVGIGSAVHIMGHYYHIVLEDPHRSSRDIVSQLMQELSLPLVATSVTTAAGFMSLLLAEMPPLQIFGLFTALGVLFVWFLSITLMPATLVIFKPKVGAYLEKRRSLRLHNEEGAISRLVVYCGGMAQKHRKRVLGVVTLISLLGVAASWMLYVDSSWIGDFRPGSDIVAANRILNEKFAGTVFLNVIVDGKEKDSLKDPIILSKIESLQAKVEKLDQVGDSLSVVDHLKSMNKAFNAGDPAFKKLPDSRRETAEYLYMASISGRPELLDEVVDAYYQHANITFAIKTDEIRKLKTVIDEVKQFVAQEFKDLPVEVHTAGMANNSYVWSDLLIRSQLASIVVSKLAVFLLAAFLLRSIVAGFFVVIPVIVTTIWVAGMTALLKIPLDVSTTLAAGIAIGVGVDYAIHYIYRYIREFAKSGDANQAALLSLRRAGRTIVLNAVVVSAGFLVLFASQFPPNTKTGYFVSSYIIISCVVALLLLPAMLALFKVRFVRTRAAVATGGLAVATVADSVQ